MGAVIKVVPPEDMAVLKKYLKASDGIALIPEELANEMGVSDGQHADYDFGGNADIFVDIVESTDHYFWDCGV